MKILSFTTLYPNASQPIHGVFVENRLRQLVATRAADVRVVAPVPWFPFKGAWAGSYGKYARAPLHEVRHGLDVMHPRYPVIPKIGVSVAPTLLAWFMRPVIARIMREGYDFDVLDAHYFYPDGVAAAWLGKWFNKPVVITGRGTDLNFLPRYPLPRRQIQWAAEKAAGMITVCQALKDSLVELGVPQQRVTVLRNGVDLQLFRPFREPKERAVARRTFGMEGGTALVSVGQLIERKGHHLIIAALPELPDAHLFIAGEGPDRAKLKNLAAELGVAGRVHFLGVVPHGELPLLYAAADISILASSREGWANVLLESMACGTPVVASRIWGTPEVVAEPAAGVLMPERSAAGVAAGVKAVLANLPERGATRRYAERFSWDATTDGQLRLFQGITGHAPRMAAE
ncbi:MAG: glycosyltransferase family 4 protein [Rhodospirillaceae bacterium]